jgi:hypothetical protein
MDREFAGPLAGREVSMATGASISRRQQIRARDFDRLANSADRAEQTSGPLRLTSKGIIE